MRYWASDLVLFVALKSDPEAEGDLGLSQPSALTQLSGSRDNTLIQV